MQQDYDTYEKNLKHTIKVDSRNYVMNVNLFRKLYNPSIDQQDCVWSCSKCYKVLSVDERWCVKCDKPEGDEYVDAAKKSLICLMCGLVANPFDIGMHRSRGKCNLLKMTLDSSNIMKFGHKDNYRNYQYKKVEDIRASHGFEYIKSYKWSPSSSDPGSNVQSPEFTKPSLKRTFSQQIAKPKKSSPPPTIRSEPKKTNTVPTLKLDFKNTASRKSSSSVTPKQTPVAKPSNGVPAIDHSSSIPRKRVSNASPSFQKIKRPHKGSSLPNTQPSNIVASVDSNSSDLVEHQKSINGIFLLLSANNILNDLVYLKIKNDPAIQAFSKDPEFAAILKKVETLGGLNMKDILRSCLGIQQSCKSAAIFDKLVELLSDKILEIKLEYQKLREYWLNIKKCVLETRCENCVYCLGTMDFTKLSELQSFMKLRLENMCNVLEAKVLILQQENK